MANRSNRVPRPRRAAASSDLFDESETVPRPVPVTGRSAAQAAQALQALSNGQGAISLLPLATSSNPKLARAVELFTVGQLAWRGTQKLRAHFAKPDKSDEIVWTVKIAENDSLFDMGLELVARQASSNERVLLAATDADSVYDAATDNYRMQYKVLTQPETHDDRVIELEGHRIVAKVTRESSEEREKNAAAVYDVTYSFKPDLYFYATSKEGQQAVLRALEDEAKRLSGTEDKRRPTLRTYGKGGYWTTRRDVPLRPVESVITSHDQVGELVRSIEQFLELEDEYARRGIPWHRGYLLYGPPGTGKTSAVKAVSGAVGLDLWYASLGETSGDSSLQSVVSDVGSRSILLLEDIDSFKPARDRGEAGESVQGGERDQGVSTSGLLNVLDGVATPHGLITIMTTNHRNFLDPALLRPGRIDRQIEFGLPDDQTVERHFEWFYQRAPLVPLEANGRSGAEVSEILLTHLFDPEQAERVLAKNTAGSEHDHDATHSLAAGTR